MAVELTDPFNPRLFGLLTCMHMVVGSMGTAGVSSASGLGSSGLCWYIGLRLVALLLAVVAGKARPVQKEWAMLHHRVYVLCEGGERRQQRAEACQRLMSEHVSMCEGTSHASKGRCDLDSAPVLNTMVRA